ncbi:MAG TPA: hypothetical protein VGO13_02510 [Solirubrobacterales bacterium]|jgi:hypothetical protein|nr:hypothetical protein [Solirubrobacterales bacterium]
MRLRFSAAFLAVLAAALLVVAASGAAMIGIYRNGMETTAQRAQLIKLSGSSCTRGGSDGALRIAIGKATDACSYRTPVLGRDLEISATERLLSGTPTALQRKAYLALELRAGAGAKYQLLAFPLQRKVQLLKVTGEGTEYLAVQKDVKGLMGVNKANALRLRVLKPAKGQAQLSAYVSGELVAEATDEAAGDLTGAASSVAVGAISGANGVIASVDDVVVRVPVDFPPASTN